MTQILKSYRQVVYLFPYCFLQLHLYLPKQNKMTVVIVIFKKYLIFLLYLNLITNSFFFIDVIKIDYQKP